ncbi:transglutaminaseTgpA domain-containing protein [Kitasatospora sp. NPDC051853]|uniref:transglutaminase family protein n=1 Tax=Kitasatospora sp. NPDC051853 TaxID=3364058 RepID=UPI0037A1C759
MTTRAKLTLYSALATVLVTLCLTPLVEPGNWVLRAVLVTAAAGGAGAGLRRLAFSRALQVPLQLLAVLYLLMLLFVQRAMDYVLLPGPRALDAVGSLLAEGQKTVQEYTAPAPATEGVQLILVGAVALIAVLVDALAVTFRRAALAGLPLLALYSVGTGLNGADNAWLWFLLSASGYLLLLFAEGQDRLSRWGRVFHGTSQDGSGTISHSGHRVGLLALACAVVIPLVVPQTGLGLFDGGSGSGAGLGNGAGRQVTSLNPVVALTANLTRRDNTELFTFRTDTNVTDLYMRIGALDNFDGVSWKFSEQRLQAIENPLPGPLGLGPDVQAEPFRTEVKISRNLSTEWLPMPYPADTVTVRGDWKYEPSTRSVVGDGGQKTDGISYSVVSKDVRPTPEQLRKAGPVPNDVARRFTTLPDSLPAVVGQTARKVVAGKNNPYDQAVALQAWFNGPEFRYSLEVAAATGNEAIERFLREKTGFCVHYAATMAAMARSLGIPARVAIGFAPGTDLGKGSFLVRSQDYHAWPELYFPGSGWLRFEPTPSRGSAPEYTAEKAAPVPSAQPTEATTAPSTAPSAAPSSSSSCTAQQQRQDGCADEQAVTPVSVEERPWWLEWPVLVAALVTLLVLALLATPMLWRIRQRRRRLGTGRRAPGGDGGGELTDQQVLAAWEELIDTAWDLGIPPDDSRTPRTTVRRIAEAGQLDDTATAAAGRVALATERVLYARDAGAGLPLGPDVRTAAEGLRASAGRRGRTRAVLLPPSSARLRRRIGDRAAAVGEAVRSRRDRLTGALRRLPGLRGRGEQD